MYFGLARGMLAEFSWKPSWNMPTVKDRKLNVDRMSVMAVLPYNSLSDFKVLSSVCLRYSVNF
jgi:hypothetical protein